MASDKGIKAGKAFVEIFADDKKLVRGLRAASRKIKAFGAGIRNIGLQITAATSAMLAPLILATKHFANFGDSIAKMAKRTGVSVEALSWLRYAASQTGTSLDDLEKGIRRMQRTISDAGRKLSTAVDVLEDLGLKYEDIKDLSPEDQFKIIGDRLGKIVNPTKRAAMAMELFGRAGTGLLPMFALGAKGMDKFRKEAEKLGLIISDEDAKAAEDLTDAIDKLILVTKMIVFHIGGALAGAVEKAADKFTKITKTISDWVKENRAIILTATKVIVAVLAIGVGLVGLGLTIQVVGIAVAGLAKIFVLFGIAIKAAIAILGFLLSPLGLVIASILALGIIILTTTKVGAKALGWLGDKFTILKDDALASFDAISDALAAGNIALAAKILWLLVKMEWQRGVSALTALWSEFSFGFKALFFTVKKEVLDIWAGLTNGLKNIWAGLLNWHERTVETWANWTAKRMLEVQGLFDDSLDVDYAKKAVDQMTAARMSKIADKHEKRLNENAKEYGKDLKENESAKNKKMKELVDADAETQKKAAKDLAAARNAWKGSVDAAKAGRDAKTPGVPDGLEKPEIPDVPGIISAAAVSVMGSFGARNIGFGSGAKDREALDAAKDTAKNTKKTVALLNNMSGDEFA